MKKIKSIILSLTLALITSITYSQVDSIYVSQIADDMEDKSYYVPSRSMLCSTPDKKTGFVLSSFFDYKNNELSVSGLSVKMVNIGSCVEKNELTILFDNETKIKLISWNDFNCKGNAWFFVSKSDLDKLSTLMVKKIKIQNGRTFESYTHELTEDNDYFIQLLYATKNKKIKEEKIK